MRRRSEDSKVHGRMAASVLSGVVPLRFDSASRCTHPSSVNHREESGAADGAAGKR